MAAGYDSEYLNVLTLHFSYPPVSARSEPHRDDDASQEKAEPGCAFEEAGIAS
jgi:hypothetical protein